MTNIRLWPRAILTVLVLAAMGGVVLWWAFFQGDGSEINAQELFESACNQSQADSFDLTVTRTSSWHDSDEIKQGASEVVQISGDDFHIKLDRGSEYMEVDGKGYYRSPTDPIYPKWYLLPYYETWWPLQTHPYGGSLSDLCPELGPVANVGRDSVGSVDTQHLEATLTYEDKDLIHVNEEGEEELFDRTLTVNWEFWVDDGGMLVQTLSERDLQTYSEWTLTKISGVGEPNVITAPATSTIVLYEDRNQ